MKGTSKVIEKYFGKECYASRCYSTRTVITLKVCFTKTYLELKVLVELWKFFAPQGIMDFLFLIGSMLRLMIQNIQITGIYLGLFCVLILLFCSKDGLLFFNCLKISHEHIIKIKRKTRIFFFFYRYF